MHYRYIAAKMYICIETSISSKLPKAKNIFAVWPCVHIDNHKHTCLYTTCVTGCFHYRILVVKLCETETPINHNWGYLLI